MYTEDQQISPELDLYTLKWCKRQALLLHNVKHKMKNTFEMYLSTIMSIDTCGFLCNVITVINSA